MAHFHSLLKVSYDRRGNSIDLNPGNFNTKPKFFTPRVVNTGRGCPEVMESPFVEMLIS